MSRTRFTRHGFPAGCDFFRRNEDLVDTSEWEESGTFETNALMISWCAPAMIQFYWDSMGAKSADEGDCEETMPSSSPQSNPLTGGRIPARAFSGAKSTHPLTFAAVYMQDYHE